MQTVTITAKNQITLRMGNLKHMNAAQGDVLEVVHLPDGSVNLKPKQAALSFRDIARRMRGKTKAKLTLEEINKATKDAFMPGEYKARGARGEQAS